MTLRPPRVARLAALCRLAAILAACAALGGPADAQAPAARAAGRLEIPPPVGEGRFEGTWYRVEMGMKQGLALRRVNGAWQARFFWETNENFSIDTRWESVHTFSYRGRPGTLELSYVADRSTPERLVFRYDRRQEGGKGSELHESGTLALYRAVDGRTLVWLIDPLRTVISIPDPIAPYEAAEPRDETKAWIFMKAAERELQWDEIYW